MQQGRQFSQLFADCGISAVFWQRQRDNLAACKQAHCLRKAKDTLPIGMSIESKGEIFSKAMLLRLLADKIKAFL